MWNLFTNCSIVGQFIDAYKAVQSLVDSTRPVTQYPMKIGLIAKVTLNETSLLDLDKLA